MFKGQEIEQGDIVTMRARSFPFEFQAAVVDYDKASASALIDLVGALSTIPAENRCIDVSDVLPAG